MRGQDVAAGHVQDVCGGELEVYRGTVGVVDDGRQESIFSWTDGAKKHNDLSIYKMQNTILLFVPLHHIALNAPFVSVRASAWGRLSLNTFLASIYLKTVQCHDVTS